MDVQWLQRDFGIYLVNLFDTYQAAKLLGFAQLSLSFLLRHYCQINADKQYQLADWRIRPLPQEMIKYAREDTHYLAFIYEKLKQDLKAKGTSDNLLTAVWNNSRLTCLKRYRIPPITDDSHLEMYRVSKKVFNERQLYALKGLYEWRDRVAREEDESTGFVLPKHMMLQIADVLPREMQGILACCSPIPPLVRQHLLQLHEIILRARQLPLSTLQHHGQPLAMPKPAAISMEQDTDDPLHCVHDLTHSQDIRDDLPTLLSNHHIHSLVTESMDESDGVRVSIKTQPQAQVFGETTEKDPSHRKVTHFVSPYTRYMRVRAQMSQEEAIEAERVEKLRRHFIESMAGTNVSSGDQEMKDANSKLCEGDSNQAAGKVVKKRLPLAVQLAKKKKRGKGLKKSVKASQETAKSAKSDAVTSEATKRKAATGKSKVQKRATEQEASVAEATSSKKSSPAKKARQETDAATTNMEPFDYSQVDYNAFKKSALRADAEGRGRGRGRGRRGNRGHSNNRIHRKSGHKSLTYSNK